jgi:ABC-type transporter Mla maintaining outer membrane lipid asymmetry ATPase subunit MlaF
MDSATAPVLELTGVRKAYGALRPLRLNALSVAPGGVVALLGLDAPAAEIFVNLVTGSSLPDEGAISLFGRSTADIADGTEWLRLLDRCGILSDRAVLLEDLTAAQNLAMTFTLDIDPVPAEVRADVQALGHDVALDAAALERKVATLGPLDKLRVRLGRAVALRPDLLLMEHPTASLQPPDVERFATDLRALLLRRALAAVAVTADTAFAAALTGTVLELQPATGDLVARGGAWDRVRRLFGR